MKAARILQDILARVGSGALRPGSLLCMLVGIFLVTTAALAPAEALWSKNLTIVGTVSMGAPTCTLTIMQDATVESGGNTTYSYKLTGGAAGCKDISYVALPVCFDPRLAPLGLVLSEAHPAGFAYSPQNGGPFGKRVKWDGVSAGPGPFNATFRFTIAGTGIPTVQVQAQTHAGSGNAPVDSGLVSVPQPTSCSSTATNSATPPGGNSSNTSETSPDSTPGRAAPTPTATPTPTPTPQPRRGNERGGPTGGPSVAPSRPVAIYGQ